MPPISEVSVPKKGSRGENLDPRHPRDPRELHSGPRRNHHSYQSSLRKLDGVKMINFYFLFYEILMLDSGEATFRRSARHPQGSELLAHEPQNQESREDHP